MDATPYLKQMTFNTDIQKTEKEIAVLQKKLELLKEIETHKSQPRMNFELGGKFEIVSYNGENYYRLEFDDESHSWYKRREKLDGNLLKLITDGETYRLLEGVWFNDVKHGKYDDEVAEPSIPSMINCIIRGNPPNGCSSWSEWFELFGSKGILHNLNISAKEYQPTEPQTLYDALRKLDRPMFIDDVLGAVENWLPKEHELNSDGWNKCVRMLREKLR